jgi:hypothetical protein
VSSSILEWLGEEAGDYEYADILYRMEVSHSLVPFPKYSLMNERTTTMASKGNQRDLL